MKYAAPIAVSYGLGIEQVAAMTAKLGDAGIQGEMAGTALRGMMTRLSKPTKEVSSALAALGVEVKKNGKMKDMATLLAELAKAEEKLTDAGRMRANATIFGTEALSAASVLMKAAADGSRKDFERGLKESGTTEEVARRQLDNLAGDVTILKSGLEGLQLTIYDAVQPALRSMTQWATDAVAKVQEWCKANPELTKTLTFGAAAIAGIAAAALPLVAAFKTAAFVGGLFKTVMLGINLAMTANPIGLVVAAVAALGAGVYAAYQHFEPFRNAVNACWDTLKGFGGWLKDTLLAIVEKIGAAFKAVGDAVKGVSAAGANFAGKSDAEIFSEAGVPGFATGGIVSKPTLAMVGEGSESEAILPLSRLAGMIGNAQASVASGMSVSFAPVINISGGGADAYDQVKRGLAEGRDSLRRELERLMSDQRRLSYA